MPCNLIVKPFNLWLNLDYDETQILQQIQHLVNMLSEQLDGACHDEYVVHVDNQTNAC